MRLADIRLHGEAAPQIDYYATFLGRDLERRAFYELRREGMRLFAHGNELQVAEGGVVFHGTGGMLSEYMFGSSQPVEDLLSPAVRNRLVMFGGVLDEPSGRVKFSNITSGFDFYARAFAEGNALVNLYFFVTPPQTEGGTPAEIQQALVKKAGRLLKYYPGLSDGDDEALARALHQALGDPAALVCLLRLEHRGHRRYQTRLKSLMSERGELDAASRADLYKLSQELNLAPYLEERLRLDLIARQPGSAQLLGEYRSVLAHLAKGTGEEGGPLDAGGAEKFRLRLATLSTRAQRQGLPAGILDRFDAALRGEAGPPAASAAGSVAQELFSRLLLTPGAPAATPQDLQMLLRLKKTAHDRRDESFEALLLETGRKLDEITRDGGEETFALMDNFSAMLALFDRFDAVEALVAQLAFMEEASLDAERVRSLAGHAQEFESLGKGFFDELFLRPLRANPYVLQHGRRKLQLLTADAFKGDTASLHRELDAVTGDERLYDRVYRHAKERLKSFYFELGDPAGQEALKGAIEADLLQQEGILDEIPGPLFERVILDIRKESFYVNSLLPDIIKQQQPALRTDFLRNAGLDRWRIEQLEREYFEVGGLDKTLLEKLQSAEG